MYNTSTQCFKNLLEEFIQVKTRVIFEKLPLLEKMLEEFSEIKRQYQQKNREESLDFNYFSFFNINETKHSELLAYLLNPYESHGQGNLFLKFFLERLGIEAPDSNNWTVTAEKERIDILLTRANPHSVIIIENKSNWAVDQPNQLFRYWFYQIHKKNLNIDYNSDESKKRYRIIYLTPDILKQPSENSLIRPEDLKDETDIVKVPINHDSIEFYEIAEWLEPSIEILHEKNYKLKSYLNQYFELIKNIG